MGGAPASSPFYFLLGCSSGMFTILHKSVTIRLQVDARGRSSNSRGKTDFSQGHSVALVILVPSDRLSMHHGDATNGPQRISIDFT